MSGRTVPPCHHGELNEAHHQVPQADGVVAAAGVQRGASEGEALHVVVVPPEHGDALAGLAVNVPNIFLKLGPQKTH